MITTLATGRLGASAASGALGLSRALLQGRLFESSIYIGVGGSRRRNTREDFQLTRSAILSVYSPGDVLVSGGCKKGGDRFAEVVAEELGIRSSMRIFLPDLSLMDPDKNPRWEFARVCKIRNTEVARLSDVFVACVHSSRKGGTEDAIIKFRRFHPTGEIILT